MKLEIKHLAAYLPYELRIWNSASGNFRILTKLNTRVVDKIDRFKPVLKPLSEVPKDEINRLANVLNYTIPRMGHIINGRKIGYLRYGDVVTLLRNHYDVFGLIDEGLAIDINTLEK